MLERTPETISPQIIDLCKGINSNVQPIFLDIENTQTSTPLDCFNNVNKKIKLYGGDIQYGWRIWEWPKIMLEAEFHAVWKDQDGKLHDISTAPDPIILKVLFIPDYSREYKGIQINNIRIPLQEDPLIIDLISINDRLFEAMNRDELLHVHGYIKMTDEMRALDFRKSQLLFAIVNKFQ